MKLPVLQPPSPDAPATASLADPINAEVTLQVIDLVGELTPKYRGGRIPIGVIFDQLGRRKHKEGVSRPTLLWSLWRLWNDGTIAFEEADSDDATLPKGKAAEITMFVDRKGARKPKTRVRPVRIGYVKIALHGASDLSAAATADKYAHGPSIDKPSKSGLSLPEKTWPGHPLDWVAKGAPLTVAYGGGVDSTAMIIEMARQRLPIELVLFADVGSEKPETYAYLDVMDRFLQDHGYPKITRVRYEMTPQGIARRVARAEEARKLLAKGLTHWPKGAGAGEDDLPQEIRPIDPRGYSSLGQNCIYNLTYPSLAYGFQDHNCSAKWKVKPQVDFIAASKEFGPRAQQAWARGLPVIRTIGFDAGPGDRGRRNRIPDDIHHLHWYPLQDWGWDRERAIEEIRKSGMPVPLKSACFFCPSTQPEEVEWLVREHPEIIDEIRLIEDSARPYNEGGPQQGLWYLGSKMPADDQQRFGHEYWFEGGSAKGDELARFVELHYLRGGSEAVPEDPSERAKVARRIIVGTDRTLSVRQIARKDRGGIKITPRAGGSLTGEQRAALKGIGIDSDKGDAEVTIAPEGVELYLGVWLQSESLRLLGAVGAPTPGRMSDFVTAYEYLCRHHPGHSRCKGWQPGKPRKRSAAAKETQVYAESNPARCWRPGSTYETVRVGKSDGTMISRCADQYRAHGYDVRPAGVVKLPRKGGVYRTPLSDITGVHADPWKPERLQDALAKFRKRMMPKPIQISVSDDGGIGIYDGNHRLSAARQLNVPAIDVEWSYEHEQRAEYERQMAGNYPQANPVIGTQESLPEWRLGRRGAPGIAFYGDNVGNWSAKAGFYGSMGWVSSWWMDPSGEHYAVEGATEYHPGFRESLREMVNRYPELLGLAVRFDGPAVPIADLVSVPPGPIDWARVKLYHGTSERAWEQIRRRGLAPRRETGAEAAYGKASEAPQGRDDLVYLTSQLQMAHMAARDAARGTGSRPVIIEIVGGLPTSRILADEDAKEPDMQWRTIIANAAVAGMDPDDDETFYTRQKVWLASAEPTAEWSLAKLGSVAYRGTIQPAKLRLVECCCDEDRKWYPCD